MPNCAICGESAKHVIDNIHLCGDCNLTLQSGNRDTLMQTLGLLARLVKAEAKLQMIAGSADQLYTEIVNLETPMKNALADNVRRQCAITALNTFSGIMLKVAEPEWAVNYTRQLADQQERIAQLETQLGTIEVWYEIEIERENGTQPSRNARLTSTEAAALFRILKETRNVRSIQVITSRLEKVVEDSGNHVS